MNVDDQYYLFVYLFRLLKIQQLIDNLQFRLIVQLVESWITMCLEIRGPK